MCQNHLLNYSAPGIFSRVYYFEAVVFRLYCLQNRILIYLLYPLVQKVAQEVVAPHQVMIGDLLLMQLPMVDQTHLVILLGLGPMVTVVEIVTLPKMVMKAQDQTQAAAVPLIDCHLHRPRLAPVIDFRCRHTSR